MATFTASLYGPDLKQVHTGLHFTGGQITEVSATGTASTVFLLAKVPQGATIVDWFMYCTTGSTSGQTLKIGTSNSESAIASEFSLTNVFGNASISGMPVAIAGITGNNDYRAPLGGNKLPVRISLSDDVEDRFVWIQATAVLDICATALFNFGVWYTMDGTVGRNTVR